MSDGMGDSNVNEMEHIAELIITAMLYFNSAYLNKDPMKDIMEAMHRICFTANRCMIHNDGTQNIM